MTMYNKNDNNTFEEIIKNIVELPLDNDNNIFEEILKNLVELPLDSDNINYVIDNLSYQENLLSEAEFNKILYDICDNKIENIIEIYNYQQILKYYNL